MNVIKPNWGVNHYSFLAMVARSLLPNIPDTKEVIEYEHLMLNGNLLHVNTPDHEPI